MPGRIRVWIAALSLAAAAFPVVVQPIYAWTPTTPCYWSAVQTDSRSYTAFYFDSSNYGKFASYVQYEIGYTCSGEPILAKVIYRSATWTYHITSACTMCTNWGTHEIASYYVLHDSYTGDYVTSNGFYNPRPAPSCSGGICSISISSGTDVTMAYNYTSNQVYTFCYICHPNSTSFSFYHKFIRHVLDEKKA